MSKTKETMMSGNTALATTTAGLPATQTATDPFAAYAKAVAPRTIVGDLLKFSKGDYFSGKDSRPVPAGTRLTANLDEMAVGWVRWRGGRPSDHVLVRVADGQVPPRRDTLGDNDESVWEFDPQGRPRDPWQVINYVPMIDREGNVYTFSVSSITGVQELGSLCNAYAHQRKNNSANEFPVVELNVGSFLHKEKSIGRIKYPQLDIVGWQPKEKFTEAMVAAGLMPEATTTAAEPKKPPRNVDVKPPQMVTAAVDDMEDEIPF